MSVVDRKGVPLTVDAHLMSAPVLSGPLLLDGVLVGAVGALLGRGAPGGLKGPAHVYGTRLPLSRVYCGDGRWWYAASQVTPVGGEERFYTHRRVAYDMVEGWTDAKTVNHSSGPDKAMRKVGYRRPDMLRLRWTCVGMQDELSALLAYVGGLGRMTTHGHGWVVRWSVTPGGPPLNDYAQDVRLRHIPVDRLSRRPRTPGVMVRNVPLHPPYHRRSKAVVCYQVVK